MGTTELMTAPEMWARRTPYRWRMSRSSMAYWSSMREASVAMRETNSSSSPSNTPKVIFVLPTSNANSIESPLFREKTAWYSRALAGAPCYSLRPALIKFCNVLYHRMPSGKSGVLRNPC